jgi:hypothetical protein
MPQLYLIVRFDSNQDLKPPYKITDLSSIGSPTSLEGDEHRLSDTYAIIDDEAAGGPWTYRVAVDIAKETGAQVRVQYGTLSREDALECFKRIPELVKEGDKDRKLAYKDGIFTKATIDWKGDTCMEVKLRKNRFCWYQLIILDVEEIHKGEEGMDDADKGGDAKKRKVEVEEAGGDDMDAA